MAKIEIRHEDMLGRQLNVGDIVATYGKKCLLVMTVKKQTAKMVTLGLIDTGWTVHRYPDTVVSLDHSPELLLFVMKRKGGLI